MPWRLYAALVVLLLLVMVQRRPLMPGAGFNWEGAQAIYWSFAPLGLVGYAYGFRILSQTFWRVYALIFTADITIRAMAKVGWVPFARLFGYPDESRHGTFVILLGLGLIAATCVALLRYGGLLKVPTTAAAPSCIPLHMESSPAVEQLRPAKQWGPRYSILHCALAALAGAAFSALVMRIYVGDWGSPAFALVEFVVAFLALVCGGRSLANRLAADGKDTIIRGAVIGGSLGALAAASIALLFAAALIGGSLFTSLTAMMTTVLLGMPFGVVDGAATGVALVLLGRLMPRAASGGLH